MQVSEIGTKLTESTIVLHLQNIDVAPITPAWLHDKLGLRTDEQWTSLNSPGNEEILAAMYDSKRTDWNAKVVRQVADGSIEELDMPPVSDLTPEQQADLLLEGAVFNAPFPTWSLPKQDFIVPFSGTLLGQMCGLTRGESASCVTVSGDRFEFPREALQALSDSVDALQRAIVARERRWRGYAKSLAAYRRVDGLCELLHRAYRHASRRLEDREEAELRVRQVAEFRATLAEAYASVMKDAYRGEEALADDVLLALDNPELADAAEKLAFDPLSVDADVAEEFGTVVRYACEFLAKSVRADVLLREHVWPAFGAAASNAPYGFSDALDKLADAELREQLANGWEGTFHEVQRRLGAPKRTGLVEVLAKAGKYYRSGPSVISNALNEGVLLLVWDGLAGNPRSSGSRLAALALRYIASMGVPDPGSARILVGGRIDVDKLFAAFEQLKTADSSDVLAARAALIKKLKLKEQFARVPVLQGLSVLAYAAAIWSATADDEIDATQRGFLIASALVGATESYGHMIVAIGGYFDPAPSLSETTEFLAKKIGRLSVILGMVASGLAFADDPKLANALSFGGGMLRVEGYAFSVLAESTRPSLAKHVLPMRIVAGWLGFAGTLMGVAAMVWSLVPPVEARQVGVAALLPEAFELMVEQGGAFSALESELRAALGELPARTQNVELAPVAGLWTAAARAGARGQWGDSEPPTYYAAQRLGFVRAEIAVMFGVDEVEVAAAGIPTSLRGATPCPKL